MIMIVKICRRISLLKITFIQSNKIFKCFIKKKFAKICFIHSNKISLNDSQKFVLLELNENIVLDFANELDRKYNCDFKLNKKDLLSFPTTLESFYKS